MVNVVAGELQADGVGHLLGQHTNNSPMERRGVGAAIRQQRRGAGPPRKSGLLQAGQSVSLGPSRQGGLAVPRACTSQTWVQQIAHCVSEDIEAPDCCGQSNPRENS